MGIIEIVKRQVVITLVLICSFPIKSVAQTDQVDFDQALREANAGNESACAYLGQMYYWGQGVVQNYSEAFKWFKKAVDNGDATSYYWLGVMYYDGKGVVQDDSEAFKWFQKAADNGSVEACFFLGVMYDDGQGVAQNYNEVFKWFQKAADAGIPQAYEALSSAYTFGLGVDKNNKLAFEYAKKAADAGIISAYYKVGYLYNNGIGTDKNEAEAFKWFQKGAQKDEEYCLYDLSLCYYKGKGCIQDYGKAFEFCKRSEERGLVNASMGLGLMYLWGQGCSKDVQKAFHYLTVAANNNMFEAYQYLARMYYRGEGCIKDYSQTKIYAEKAMNEMPDDVTGHRYLAKLYMNGYGVEQDFTKAGGLIEQAFVNFKKFYGADYPYTVMDTKGELFWLKGDKVKAKEIYDSINKNAPDFYAREETALSKFMKEYKGVDVDFDIPMVTSKNENIFAVVIANEKYQMEKAVQYAGNDGRVFAEYCKKTLGLPEKNIHYVTDATLNNLKYEIKWLQSVIDVYKGDAKVIFYYAGHGIPDEQNKNGYLLPVDGYGSDVATGYALDDLFKTLGSMPSKSVTIFLDACFSGAKRDGDMLASTRGVAIKVKESAPRGNMVVFSAAQGDETAYPYNGHNHGLFTYYLLKKLQETKGDVTLGELGDYIKTKVERQSIVANGKLQSPSIMSAPLIGNNWKTWKLNK